MYNILELGEVINVPLEGYGDFFSLPIYKIFKKEYLLRIFETNKLYFSNIFQAWEDPYELFLLKHAHTWNFSKTCKGSHSFIPNW